MGPSDRPLLNAIMKKLILFFTIIITGIATAVAQAPQSFKYQAVARDANGDIIKNQVVALRLSILKGGASGNVVYSETHTPATGAIGVFSLNVGQGTVQNGLFDAVDWGADDYWLRIEMDASGGTNYQIMGTSQLLSVPYALHAETVANTDDADADPVNELQTISKIGNTVTLSNNGGSFTDEVNDADANPSNELQNLSLNGTVVSISNGNSIDLAPVIPPGGTDDQTISLNGTTLSIEDGNAVDLSVVQDGVNDADANPSNELQNLNLNGNTLGISNGNSVDLSAYASPWETLALGINYDAGITFTKEQQVTNHVRVGNNMPTSTKLLDDGLFIDYTNKDGTSGWFDGNQVLFDNNVGNKKAIFSLDSTWFTNSTGLPVFTKIGPANLYLWDDLTKTELNQSSLLHIDKLTGQSLSAAPWYLAIDSMYENALMTQRQLSFDGASPLPHHAKLSKDSLEFFRNNPGLLFDSYSSFNADKLKIEYGTNLTELVGASLFMDNSINRTWLSPFGLLNEEELSPSDIFSRFSLVPDSLAMWNGAKWLTNWLGTETPWGNGGLRLYNGSGDKLLARLGNSDPDNLLGNPPEGGVTLFDMNGSPRALLASQQQSGWMYLEDDSTYVLASGGAVECGSKDTSGIAVPIQRAFVAGVSQEKEGFMNILDANAAIKAGMKVNTGLGEVFTDGMFTVTDNAGHNANVSDFWGSYLYDDQGNIAVSMYRDFADLNVGYLSTNGQNNSTNFFAGANWADNNPDGGLAQVIDGSGVPKAGMNVDPYENGNLFAVNGEVRLLDNLGNRWGFFDKYGINLMSTPTFINYVASMYRYPGLDNTGAVFTAGENGSLNFFAGHNSFSDNPNAVDRGYIAVANENSLHMAGIMVNDTGQGVVFGDIKNFRMDDPKDPSKEIWYASIEGPEAAAYTRGTATLENGEAFVPFPEHFRSVANPGTMTVILTPMSADTYGLAVVEKTGAGIRVKELKGGAGNFGFDWEVKCVRKGYENYQPVRDKRGTVPALPPTRK